MVQPSHDSASAARLEPGTRIAVVASNYHAELVEQMLASATRTLHEAGLAADDLLVLRAPGVFELPILARRLAQREDIDAVLCLGVVLKGATRHDEYIASSVALALQQVALGSGRPILFGVLTCETLEQARARAMPAADGGTHDKGREVARAAVAVLASLDEAARIGARSPGLGFGPRSEAAR